MLLKYGETFNPEFILRDNPGTPDIIKEIVTEPKQSMLESNAGQFTTGVAITKHYELRTKGDEKVCVSTREGFKFRIKKNFNCGNKTGLFITHIVDLPTSELTSFIARTATFNARHPNIKMTSGFVRAYSELHDNSINLPQFGRNVPDIRGNLRVETGPSGERVEMSTLHDPARQTLRVVFHLDLNWLAAHDKPIYIDDLDIVVGIADSPFDLPPHPASQAYKLIHQTNPEGKDQFTFGIRVVDNTNSFTTKYVYAGGHAYVVKPVIDNSVSDGIYITAPRPADEGGVDKRVVITDFPLEDYKEAGLYDTLEEAMTSGNPGLLKQLEINNKENKALELKLTAIESKHRLDMEKHNSDMAKITAEKESMEREAQLKAIQQETQFKASQQEAIFKASQLEAQYKNAQAEARIKADQQEATIRELREKFKQNKKAWKHEHQKLRTKNHYEEKSLDRKDQSEVLKHLPTVILGIGAALLAFKGLA